MLELLGLRLELGHAAFVGLGRGAMLALELLAENVDDGVREAVAADVVREARGDAAQQSVGDVDERELERVVAHLVDEDQRVARPLVLLEVVGETRRCAVADRAQHSEARLFAALSATTRQKQQQKRIKILILNC